MKISKLPLSKSYALIFSAFAFIMSCKKEDLMPDPDPTPTIQVEGCDSFTPGPMSLNSGTLTFECSGYTFADSTMISDANANGVWGRFGAASVTGAFLKLNYANNPKASGINTSAKVLKVTEAASIEPWAGFFFNLKEKVVFPTGKTAISVDIYSAAPGQRVTLKLEDKADNTIFKETTIATTKSGEWEKLVYNFSDAESNKYNRVTMIMNNGATNSSETIYYLDNIAFSDPAVDENIPQTAAASPSLSDSEVLSVFSDSFTNIAGTDFDPDWGQATTVEQIDVVSGNKALKYADLNYQGTQFASALNVKSYNSIHIDYWTPNSTALNFYLISTGPKETAKALPIETKVWKSIDIPLSYFASVDLGDVIQFKVDGNGTVFFDNIYFWNDPSIQETPTAPTTPAANPTQAAGNVLSIYGESYTNVAGTDFNPNWGQATTVSEYTIVNGNNALKYAGLNYQGTTFQNPLNASTYNTIHFDVWTGNSTALNFYLISGTYPNTSEKGLAVPFEIGKWKSVDLNLADFTGVNLSDIIQFKVDGDGTIFLDNIYFYNK